MIVLWEQRLVLLATPKTGSTALAAALSPYAAWSIERPPLLKHTTLQRYHRFIRPFLEANSRDSWEVAAVMREPLDWLGSWYRFRRRDDQLDPAKSTKDLSFDAFVAGWCQPERPAFADIGSQARFLQPRQGRGLDQLFRYDQMEGLIAFLEKRLGKSLSMPRLNISPKAALSLHPETLARFEAEAKADYALYNSIPRGPNADDQSPLKSGH